MTEYVSLAQFVEILEHNRDNSHDNDIWVLLDPDGNTAIIPDQPIAELQDPQSWPKYICRAGAVTAHIVHDTEKADAAVDGLYAALDHINWAIGLTMSSANSRIGRAASALARALTRQAGATL